ncbi:MAG TPA: hypothetical protein QF761_02705, partial [Pirellulales bacterium]|nr:hypothetical protein [Pirellulales bacterium]
MSQISARVQRHDFGDFGGELFAPAEYVGGMPACYHITRKTTFLFILVQGNGVTYHESFELYICHSDHRADLLW